jgi:hypothetical protein
MTRLEAARGRLRIARYAIGVAAAGAFAVFGVHARAAHPATRTDGNTPSSTAPSEDAETSTFSWGGSASISPSGGGTPSIQSTGS